MAVSSVTFLRAQVRELDSDQLWDQFLEGTAFPHHTQSAPWGRFKRSFGWRVLRTTIRRGSEVVAGAQMLIREVGRFGKLGYVPKGPSFRSFSPELAREMVGALQNAAKKERLDVVLLQPSNEGSRLANLLPECGFQPCPLEGLSTATISFDLFRELDVLFARMSESAQRRIRRSQTNGVVVRKAAAEDLPTFHRLLQATGKRQGFVPESLDYYKEWWRTLAPSGQAVLFLSEYLGEPLSGQLLLAFGDTVTAKRIGWSGDHPKVGPNVALDWATIRWAKENGYRRYDLDGIDREVADIVLAGLKPPDWVADTPAGYKLRLGGDVALLPPAYCWWRNRVLAKAWGAFGPRLLDSDGARSFASRFRST